MQTKNTAAPEDSPWRAIGATRPSFWLPMLWESDRVAAIIHMLENIGGQAWSSEDTLTVCGTGFTGGTVDSVNDHRIAMSAAIAATVCREPLTVLDAEAVNKSYPLFWDDFRTLGGNYEQHLR